MSLGPFVDFLTTQFGYLVIGVVIYLIAKNFWKSNWKGLASGIIAGLFVRWIVTDFDTVTSAAQSIWQLIIGGS